MISMMPIVAFGRDCGERGISQVAVDDDNLLSAVTNELRECGRNRGFALMGKPM
jgi:hypothetical protein